MSQHDMILDNASGAAFRADANNLAQALASMSKGNTRPPTIYAGQPWLDDNTPSTSVWSWYVWTGSADIKVGELNTTTNNFMPFVNGSALSSVYAPLASPPFTGTPSLPTGTTGVTQAAADNSTKLATTAHVKAAIAAAASPGELVNYAAAAVAGYTSASGITPIPLDDTVPTSSEGYEWGSISYTPVSAGNRLLVRATLFAGEPSNNSDGLVQALFKDADASALAANCSNVLYGVVVAGVLVTEHEMAAGTTSAVTFRARASGNLGATTLDVNGAGGARLFGGVAKSKLEVWEFTP